MKNNDNNLTKDSIPQQRLMNIHVDNLKGLKNLDIDFDKNLTAIMGVNGVGKSTIIHALACIYRPYHSEEDYKFSFSLPLILIQIGKTVNFQLRIGMKNTERVYKRI